MKSIKVAVVGATGYVGIELVRLLLSHSHVEIRYICATSSLDSDLSDIYPHFRNGKLVKISHFDNIDFDQVELVFLCLPHYQAHSLIQKIPRSIKIIDLSADFRIKDENVYAEWYGKHSSPHLIKNFTYGLTEIYRDTIKRSEFIACPGCYATCALIPLMPLLQSEIIKDHNIIIDAKSGVSGAGRKVGISNFCEVNESIKVYSISNHRHVSEIEQELHVVSGVKRSVIQFTPHLIPVNRGILCCTYVEFAEGMNISSAREELHKFYSNSSFVIVDDDRAVNTRSVVGTNLCYMGLFPDRRKNHMIIVSVIDNLLKGSSGQAVQNFNLMFNLKEDTGLINIPYYP